MFIAHESTSPLRLATIFLFAAIGLTATATVGIANDALTVAADNRRCFNCHGQEHIAELPPAERSGMVAPTPDHDWSQAEQRRPGLLVMPDQFGQTLHGSSRCVDCHTAARQLPHPAGQAPATCNDACHSAARIAFDAGAHGQIAATGRLDAPRCATCHGGHEMTPVGDRQSRLHPLRVAHLCADCHSQHGEPVAGVINGQESMQQYLASVHGRALAGSGLVVAATCVSCHGAHDVRSANDPASTVHRNQVTATCGTCHLGVADTYEGSIHGQLLAQGRDDAPVCSDCHTAHAITRAGTSSFYRDIVNECGDCHNQPREGRRVSLYDSYRRSYHGQVMTLGSTRAASCSGCHGAHDILPASDPASHIHADNRVAMCASCHPGATANFAAFEPHADYRDRERYPILWAVWLYFMIVIGATFSFFGLHSILWLVRSVINRVRQGAHPRPKVNAHGIKRFSRVDRINHALLIVTFFGLTITGMPLLFADQPWAAMIARMFGGVHGAGLWHRIFAVGLMINCAVHAVGVGRRIRRYGARNILLGPNSMLPRWKDVTDCIGMFRWFFGGSKPRFDRWTYWEKFDYWAEIFGTAVIGATGLMLWFPTLLPGWLPGWVLNAAFIIHGYEALLAAGFIFTIHFFNAHLRLEKFPVDDVMFTGQLPEEEFAHERPEEYERAVSSGQIELLRVPPAPRWQRPVAVIVGILAMAIGGTLVLLVVVAGLRALG